MGWFAAVVEESIPDSFFFCNSRVRSTQAQWLSFPSVRRVWRKFKITWKSLRNTTAKIRSSVIGVSCVDNRLIIDFRFFFFFPHPFQVDCTPYSRRCRWINRRKTPKRFWSRSWNGWKNKRYCWKTPKWLRTRPRLKLTSKITRSNCSTLPTAWTVRRITTGKNLSLLSLLL